METATIVGWVFLILSFILPSFVKDDTRKRILGASLNALALGVFIGHLLGKL
jgi:hypothetical protein